CIAVGDVTGADGRTRPAVQSWDGTSWTEVPTPQPSAGYSTLRSVSCPSPSSCTAVGWATNGQNAPLIESWDGSAWTIKTTSTPNDGVLFDVSCVDGNSCTAVGWNNSGSLIASGGDQWSVVPSPQTSNGQY